jgi:hypothetical protein
MVKLFLYQQPFGHMRLMTGFASLRKINNDAEMKQFKN